MTSILFQIGRELVNEVQAGIKAHNDVKEGKPVERREDKWGDPMAPKTVYSIVRGVEEQLGMGKGKGKQAEAGPSASDKEDQVAKGEGVVDLAVSNPTPSEPGPSSSPATASLSTPDQGTKAEVSDLDTAIQSGISSPPSYASAINDTPGTSSAVRSSSEEPVRPSEKAEHPKAIGQPSSLDRIQLDALGVPLPRESGLTTEHRPPPPPPPTRADKIHKHLETADEVAAEIALGVLIGHVLDGPTQTLVEGLMSIEDDETPQSKKNRDALKAARKEIDKQTPKREALAKKLAGLEGKLDDPAGARSEKEVQKDHKRLKEKMDEVKKVLTKIEGKLEKAEYDIDKYKPRVEEHERLTIEKRARKLKEKQDKEAQKRQMVQMNK